MEVQNSQRHCQVQLMTEGWDGSVCVCVCVCWGGMHLKIRDFPGGPEAKAPASNAGGPGSILGQGTRSHMLQLEISYAITKTQNNPPSKK